jgi:hypothetical protein
MVKEILFRGHVAHYWGDIANIVVNGLVEASFPHYLQGVKEGAEVEITIKVADESNRSKVHRVHQKKSNSP